MSEWISVKDRLPEDGIHILIYKPNMMLVGWYKKSGLWVVNSVGLPCINRVTHWQPLPPPP